MKQIFNKTSFGIFFVLVFGFLLIPSHNASAILVASMEMNGGGGGGGGGTGGGSSTPTPVITGAISLVVQPDKSIAYIGGSNMILSSTASVAVCSNTALNLRVTGNITGPESKSVGTLLDQSAVGGQILASSSNITVPKTPGTYTFSVTADRYDSAGTALKAYSDGNIPINLTNFTITIPGQSTTFLINTNYRGRITNVTTSGGISVPLLMVSGSGITGSNGVAYGAISITDAPIKTYSTSFTFDVVSLSAGLTAIDTKILPSKPLYTDPVTHKTEGVKSGNNAVKIQWAAANFPDPRKVTCTLPSGPQPQGVVNGEYYLPPNLTTNTQFTFSCTDDVVVIPPVVLIPAVGTNNYGIVLNPTSNTSSSFVSSYYPYTPITTDSSGKILNASSTQLCTYQIDSNTHLAVKDGYNCGNANGTSYQSLSQILSTYVTDLVGNNSIILIPSHTWSNGVYSFGDVANGLTSQINLVKQGSDYYLYYK